MSLTLSNELLEDLKARLENEIYVNTVLREKLRRVREAMEAWKESRGGDASSWTGTCILNIIDG